MRSKGSVKSTFKTRKGPILQMNVKLPMKGSHTKKVMHLVKFLISKASSMVDFHQGFG
jgi:hypothetical protein